MKKKKPLILVTNDDGMFAPGIKALVSVAQKHGDVVVVAPNSPQSGQGHAITIHDPIKLHKVDVFKGIEAYECSGTPVDCVKLAKDVVLKGRKADLCVSGINHGLNSSINIIYSGTMSAAMEASIEDIPSIGFSLDDYSFEADFSGAKYYVNKLIKKVLKKGMGKAKLLNVNIPNLKKDKIKGFKVCRQAQGKWVEEFNENKDPRGQKYYWLTGEFIHHKAKNGVMDDVSALKKGYISIVPSMHDLTDYASMNGLRFIE